MQKIIMIIVIFTIIIIVLGIITTPTTTIDENTPLMKSAKLTRSHNNRRLITHPTDTGLTHLNSSINCNNNTNTSSSLSSVISNNSIKQVNTTDVFFPQ